VEYAIEAINNAGTCVGLQGIDGIVLAAEKRVVSKLLAPSKTSEKTYTLDDHCVCLVAGLTADANILIQRARLTSQRWVDRSYVYTYVDECFLFLYAFVYIFVTFDEESSSPYDEHLRSVYVYMYVDTYTRTSSPCP
jgi:20S proteasome alpha/beta subunit